MGVSLKPFYLTESGIQDLKLHRENQALFADLIDQQLESIDSSRPAELLRFLNYHIHDLGQLILQKGFDLSAYHYSTYRDPNLSYLYFTVTPIWEGKMYARRPLPLTFFLYVWPSESLARQCNSIPNPQDDRAYYYASDIHSHPITCAFTVLRGRLIQETYSLIQEHPVDIRKIDEQTFKEGEYCVDDHSGLFIHRLVSRQTGNPTISLHAYGAGGAYEVIHLFQQHAFQFPYHE